MNDYFIRVHPVYFQGREDGITTILIRANAVYKLESYEFAVESDAPDAGPALGTSITFGPTGTTVHVTETEDEVLMLLNESMHVASVRD